MYLANISAASRHLKSFLYIYSPIDNSCKFENLNRAHILLMLSSIHLIKSQKSNKYLFLIKVPKLLLLFSKKFCLKQAFFELNKVKCPFNNNTI